MLGDSPRCSRKCASFPAVQINAVRSARLEHLCKDAAAEQPVVHEVQPTLQELLDDVSKQHPDLHTSVNLHRKSHHVSECATSSFCSSSSSDIVYGKVLEHAIAKHSTCTAGKLSGSTVSFSIALLGHLLESAAVFSLPNYAYSPSFFTVHSNRFAAQFFAEDPSVTGLGSMLARFRSTVGLVAQPEVCRTAELNSSTTLANHVWSL